MKYEFKWKDPDEMEDQQVKRPAPRDSHSDPTADAAIRNIMRESRKKKHGRRC